MQSVRLAIAAYIGTKCSHTGLFKTWTVSVRTPLTILDAKTIVTTMQQASDIFSDGHRRHSCASCLQDMPSTAMKGAGPGPTFSLELALAMCTVRAWLLVSLFNWATRNDGEGRGLPMYIHTVARTMHSPSASTEAIGTFPKALFLCPLAEGEITRFASNPYVS